MANKVNKKRDIEKKAARENRKAEEMQNAEEKFARNLGKIGTGMFIIIVAKFFDIPESYKNLYLAIAIAIMGFDVAKSVLFMLMGKSKINIKTKGALIEIAVVVFTIIAILAGFFTAAASIVLLYETYKTVNMRPI